MGWPGPAQRHPGQDGPAGCASGRGAGRDLLPTGEWAAEAGSRGGREMPLGSGKALDNLDLLREVMIK